jgi:protein-L-isoaspartate O-methyltransferase
MPGLVMFMLEALDVRGGHRILEIGTGTGYSTALLCHRLGSGCVTSIEYDPTIADRARAALALAGHQPAVVLGDGAAGYPDRAPYDRVIATCSFTHVPYAWVAQSREGAKIMVTLDGANGASAFATLTVEDKGRARGRFHPDTISFMMSRSHPAPDADDSDISWFDTVGERPSDIAPDVFDDRTFRFLLQCSLPCVTSVGPMRLVGERTWVHGYLDAATRAWGSYRIDNGVLLAREGAFGGIWSQIERAYCDWNALGRPPLHAFELMVTADGQALTIPGTDVGWPLAISSGHPDGAPSGD